MTILMMGEAWRWARCRRLEALYTRIEFVFHEWIIALVPLHERLDTAKHNIRVSCEGQLYLA